MECRWFALIHHDDLRLPRPDRVDLKDYPAAATERIIDQRHYRRDPILRGSPFAGGAFLWSDIPHFLPLDRRDRAGFAVDRERAVSGKSVSVRVDVGGGRIVKNNTE